jgi:trimethylguanosine synthase
MLKHLNSDICPFGPELQRYWDLRYDYFSRFDAGIQIDAEGLHTVMPEQAALVQAKWLPGHVILDGFAGVGGCAIAYAKAGKQVIAVELCKDRLEMAKHNARLYGVEDAITFIHADIFAVATTIKADIVHLDPPWCWPRLKEMNRFRLQNFGVDMISLLDLLFRHFQTIALRVPPIFSDKDLDQFKADYIVHPDKQQDRIISHTILLQR